VSQLHSDSIGTKNAGSTPRQIDRVPQPGEVIYYRRFHHGKNAETVERLTVIPNPDKFYNSKTLIHFEREDKTTDCIIAEFVNPPEFNMFLFWN
jgi:hypothetical protein